MHMKAHVLCIIKIRMLCGLLAYTHLCTQISLTQNPDYSGESWIEMLKNCLEQGAWTIFSRSFNFRT